MVDNFRTLDAFVNRVADNGTKKLARVDSVEFDHVSFTYPQTNRLVLDDVCFNITKIEKTAFVGLNGSGKTTIIKLLLRMYDPDGGVIRVNGTDIREYTLASLRAQFSLDPMAEHEIFNALRTLTEGKWTMFTSHRLSNVSLADRVIVLENGRIIEDGTQEELLRNGQRYAELFNYQKEKYEV
jgi:ABC-type multidrug transport system fused ATPase/permease subunit